MPLHTERDNVITLPERAGTRENLAFTARVFAEYVERFQMSIHVIAEVTHLCGSQNITVGLLCEQIALAVNAKRIHLR